MESLLDAFPRAAAGEPAAALLARLVTSANTRLVCEQCNSENWFVPGGKRDPKRRNGTEIRPA